MSTAPDPRHGRGARRTAALSLAALAATSSPAAAGEPVDLDVVNLIRDEGLNRSQVVDTMEYLTDVLGARLSGSPEMKAANEWTAAKLEEWGLENVELDPFEFGRGWSFSHAAVHMLAPHQVPLLALPKAWTPGTAGAVRGRAVRIEIEHQDDFDRYRGELRGKVVFLDERFDVKPPTDPFRRHSDKDLAELGHFPIPDHAPTVQRLIRARQWRLRRDMYRFLGDEGVLAAVNVSSRDAGLVRVMGYTYRPGQAPSFPVLVMAVEHYNQILRLLGRGIEVELELDLRARFHDDDGGRAYNTVGEIPGHGRKPEIVMAGAHLDSWHGSTGGVDNAAGCAVMMEAVRILKAIDADVERTVRVALWSGEEQGLHGSREYVYEHFASRPEHPDPEQREMPRFLREPRWTWPITTLPDYDRFSVYFNLDNGSGKVRGVYAEENAAARPIFDAWLRPFADLGAGTETLRPTGGTDHRSFQAVGLPGFQFIQDPLDYRFRLHHTNIDGFDHIQAEDLKQASVIVASFLYHAATREERFPRKPMPQEPDARARDKRARDLDEARRKHQREQRKQRLPD